VGIEQTNGNQQHCGLLQTSIAFRCSESVPFPGIVEWVPPTDPTGNPCIYNISWTVNTVCPLPPAPDRPDPKDEGGAFALTTFLVIFLGGGLYFVGGTLANSRCVQLTVLRRRCALSRLPLTELLGMFARLPNASSNFYNNIPQKDFWFDLPSLVQDGVAFSASLGKHKGKKQFIDGYEDVSDEEQEALTIADADRDKDEERGGSGGGVLGAMANSSTTKTKEKKKKKKAKPKPSASDQEPKE
jgi:hypothetical protein